MKSASFSDDFVHVEADGKYGAKMIEPQEQQTNISSAEKVDSFTADLQTIITAFKGILFGTAALIAGQLEPDLTPQEDKNNPIETETQNSAPKKQALRQRPS